MTRQKLNTQQLLRLERSVQAGLDAAGKTLKMLLDGNIRIGIITPEVSLVGVCVSLGLNGALTGGVTILLPEMLAVEIVKKLTADAHPSLLDEQARSAIKEFGNILASAFVVHFDQHQGLRTMPTPPDLSFVRQDPPVFDSLFWAEFYWSSCLERGQVLVGLDSPALDILLAG
ncbi:chemotaxis protein CheX [Geopsychrobacter electrodiphilus]|uniref:chemotaxis protein CheX n=1 Tax=Geopsychrobacter electrodiphilus TaxID=225196 RepID=UPI00036D2134|nr:chemotaxis protein CheX [Geopsychrobacter electrodiphilus]